jgi:hypothetical protein
MSTGQQDPIKMMKDAGLDVDQLPPAQREALATLSPQEVQTLIAVHKRTADEGEVKGFARQAGEGGIIF